MAQYVNQWQNQPTLDTNMYPKGTYVVLLTTCSGEPTVWRDSMKPGWCYKLSTASDSRTFSIEKDNKGGGNNGWSLSHGISPDYDSKLKLRAATYEEIQEYIRLSKPFDATLLKRKPESATNNSYPIF